MKRTCRVTGCSSHAGGYGAYCTKHKTTDRRHGAPTQLGVTKAELKPYRAKIKARIEKNAENPVWPKAEQRWNDVVNAAESVLTRFASGRPGFGWERRAALEVVSLSKHVSAREVIETVLAMYLMLEMEPSRFVSDRAFRTQLVRRVRGLSRANADEWIDEMSGKLKRTYSELPPRVTRTIAEWLASALGGIGVYLADFERTVTREKERETRELVEALEGMR